jgi:RimJ/RimL family protein N-acetyltransferase
VYNCVAVNGVTVLIHPHVLPEVRSKYARESCLAALKWIYDNAPKYVKITALIPVIHKNVKLFAKRIGFKEEGINRKSYLKDGKVIDQWLLGITRSELGDVLNVINN